MSGEHALAHVKNPSVFANVAPTAAGRFALHFSIGQDMHTDVIPWLRKLGIRADEAQRLSTLCESIPDASIEERLKYALSCHDTKARLRQPAAA